MIQNKEIVKRIGDIERRISDGEVLLRRTERAGGVGWLFIAIGLLMILLMGDAFIILGLIIIAVCVWGLVIVARYRKEVEESLREYRGKKVEMQATLVTKE
jgi:hypothetical protein